jgi:prepilin-type N-terminal cleavage/methylation domain-containing protein
MNYKKQKGFTLIEMLVVIAIIGILSTVLLVSITPSRNKAKESRVMSNVRQMMEIAHTFYDPSNMWYDMAGFRNSPEYTKIYNDLIKNGVRADECYLVFFVTPYTLYIPCSSTFPSTSTSFFIRVKLPTDKYFCISSNGKVGMGSATAECDAAAMQD